MSKIFVRERRHVNEGAGRPRFAVVATSVDDLKFYRTHLRRAEIEKVAAELGAEIVYLPRGEQEAEGEAGGGGGKGRRHRRRMDAED